MRARVKPKETFLFGSPKRIPFTVQVDEPIAGSYQLPHRSTSSAIIPGWVKPAAGLAVAAVAALAFLPGILFPPEPTAAPSQGGVIPTPTALITLPPVTDAPPVTPGPDAVARHRRAARPLRGDASSSTRARVSSSCASRTSPAARTPARSSSRSWRTSRPRRTGPSCWTSTRTRMGSLPLLVEWEDAIYQYSSAVGETGETDRVRVDLAPFIGGVPGYVLIDDTVSNQIRKYTLPPGDGEALYKLLYTYTPAPDPTQLPLPSGIFRYDILVPLDRQWIFDFDWTP